MAFLMCSRSLLKPVIRNAIPSACVIDRIVSVHSSSKCPAHDAFFEKNERLKRPLSPHLTIYKPQLTSILSLCHRTTGIILATGLYGLSLGTLVTSATFPQIIESLQSLHIASPVIFSVKFALAWVVFYHAANGVRHLMWDMGYGFDLKTLYNTGYLVLGLSLGASLLAASS